MIVRRDRRPAHPQLIVPVPHLADCCQRSMARCCCITYWPPVIGSAYYTRGASQQNGTKILTQYFEVALAVFHGIRIDL